MHHTNSLNFNHFCFSTLPFPDVLSGIEGIGKHGFKCVEIAPPYDIPPDAREVKRRLSDGDFQKWHIHAPTLRNALAILNPDWQDRALKVFFLYLVFAAEIGAWGIIVHPVPSMKYQVRGQTGARQLKGLVRAYVQRSLDVLLPIAEQMGVSLLLENLPYNLDSPYLDYQEIKALVDSYNHPQLGTVLDVGHSAMRGIRPEDDIKQMGDDVKVLHLSDLPGEMPNDDHLVPMDGVLNWVKICGGLKEKDYQGELVFEVMQDNNHDINPDKLSRNCMTISQLFDEWIYQ